jgi:2-oxoglutarate ferredoxin oxidoreductase subunit beta
VARWTVFHVRKLIESIKKSLQKEGFSFIEAVTPCTEIYGQYNRMGTAVDMMKRLKKASEIRDHYDPVKAEITPTKIIVGEFVDTEKPGYNRLLREMISRAQKKGSE